MTTKTLAIDSCLGNGSVAIASGSNIVFFEALADSGTQAEKLVILVESALSEANISYSDLSCIAVTVGPGSFTSVRIGLSMARGMAFASNVEIIGFSSLACIAEASGNGVVAVIPAGRGESYWQAFAANGETINEIAASTEDEIKKFAEKHNLPISSKTADARDLAVLATKNPAGNAIAMPTQPIYIRPPDAKLATKDPLTGHKAGKVIKQ